MPFNGRGRTHHLVQQFRRRRSLRAGLTQLLYIGVGVGLGLLVPTLDAGARIPSVEVAALLACYRRTACADWDRLRATVSGRPTRRGCTVAAAAFSSR